MRRDPRSPLGAAHATGPSVQVLGPPRLAGANGAARLAQRKHWAVLGYLLATPEGASRAHLASLLWPDQGPAHARTNLRVTLTTLRRALGEVLDANRTHVRLDATAVDADVTRLHAWRGAHAPRDGEPAGIDPTRAFLEGVVLEDAPEFMDWLADAQDHVRSVAHDAWSRAAAAAEADGDLADAIRLTDVASRVA
ncbi:MAG: hypothetical protein RI554_09930, partial [Trueperaceae bacterium]|nr:hypothetical protein [Trueperaceae bacterium]